MAYFIDMRLIPERKPRSVKRDLYKEAAQAVIWGYALYAAGHPVAPHAKRAALKALAKAGAAGVDVADLQGAWLSPQAD